MQARENQVATESIDICFLYMFIVFLIHERSGKSKINDAYFVLIKNVLFGACHLMFIRNIGDEEIVELKIIINIACIVDLLQNGNELNSKGIDLLRGEWCVSFGE